TRLPRPQRPRPRLAVRQAREHDVHRPQLRFLRPDVAERRPRHAPPSLRLGRGEAQLEAGMALYQSAEFAARISSSAEDAGARVIIHRSRIVIHRPGGGVKGAPAGSRAPLSVTRAPLGRTEARSIRGSHGAAESAEVLRAQRIASFGVFAL